MELRCHGGLAPRDCDRPFSMPVRRAPFPARHPGIRPLLPRAALHRRTKRGTDSHQFVIPESVKERQD